MDSSIGSIDMFLLVSLVLYLARWNRVAVDLCDMQIIGDVSLGFGQYIQWSVHCFMFLSCS